MDFQDLSPVTRAMLEACEEDPRLTTAIRALAEHTPSQRSPDDEGPLDHWRPDPHTRRELLNVANEIDAFSAS